MWEVLTRGQKRLNFPPHTSWTLISWLWLYTLSTTLSVGCWSLCKFMDCPPAAYFLSQVNSISMKGPWREISFQPGRGSEMPQWDQSDLEGDAWEHSPVPAWSSTVIGVLEGTCPYAVPQTWLGIQKDLEFYFRISHCGFSHRKIIRNLVAWYLVATSVKRQWAVAKLFSGKTYCWNACIRFILFITQICPHIWINWFSCSCLALLKIYASCLSVEIIVLN